MPGKFDLKSIATQNTQTACTLQLLVKPFLDWVAGESREERGSAGAMFCGLEGLITGGCGGPGHRILYTRRRRREGRKQNLGYCTAEEVGNKLQSLTLEN